jgi:hypothetical protein
MGIKSLINEIISFPEKFRSGNISIYSFLKGVGYFEDYDQVQEDNIAKALIQHPEYINTWFGWSEDKRVTSGWYIQDKEDGNYIVGYSPKNDKHPQMSYTNITKACAGFIKREIEDVRTRMH